MGFVERLHLNGWPFRWYGNRTASRSRRQRGMFSFLGISPEQVRERHAVYMVDSSRINVAGLR